MPDSVLITGCTAGSAGEGLAIAFQKRGLHVFATARKLSNLDNLAKLPNVTVIALNVTSPGSKLVKRTGDGKLKHLFNNAGIGIIGPILDLDLEEGRKLFEVNYWGTIAMTQAFVPLIKKTRGGTVTNIGRAYSSSKASLHILSSILRLELEPLGITVLHVVAGVIKTNFFAPITESYIVPPTSYYTSLKHVLIEKASGKSDVESSGISAEDFGEKVADDVLGGKWVDTNRGAMAWAIPIMQMSLMWFQDRYGRQRGRLNEFKHDKGQ